MQENMELSDSDLSVASQEEAEHGSSGSQSLGGNLHIQEMALLEIMAVPEATGQLLDDLVKTTETSRELEDRVATCVTQLLSEIKRIERKSAKDSGYRYFLIGRLLNLMEDRFETKAGYMRWVRTKFKTGLGLEALRQAKRIARLDEYALNLLALGKNGLLELYYLFRKAPDVKKDHNGNITSERMKNLLSATQLLSPDAIDLADAKELRIRMDTLITLFRMLEKGIDSTVCSGEDARMIALFRSKAVETYQVEKVDSWLNQRSKGRKDMAGGTAPADENMLRKQDFENWVLNRMVVPKESETPVENQRLMALAKQMRTEATKYRDNEILRTTIEGNNELAGILSDVKVIIDDIIIQIQRPTNTTANMADQGVQQ